MNRRDAYFAAVLADEVFEAQLVRVFGKAKAADARYQVAPYADADLNAAKVAKVAADETMRTTEGVWA